MNINQHLRYFRRTRTPALLTELPGQDPPPPAGTMPPRCAGHGFCETDLSGPRGFGAIGYSPRTEPQQQGGRAHKSAGPHQNRPLWFPGPPGLLPGSAPASLRTEVKWASKSQGRPSLRLSWGLGCKLGTRHSILQAPRPRETRQARAPHTWRSSLPGPPGSPAGCPRPGPAPAAARERGVGWWQALGGPPQPELSRDPVS